MNGKSKQRLSFESLEAKQLLAGDVGAEVVNGILFVKGDELDNQVAIASTDVPGSYAIVGLDGTTVNGGDERVVVEGAHRGTHVNLGEGDDALRIAHAHFRNLRISMGTGDDTVAIGAERDGGDEADAAGVVDEVDRPRQDVHVGHGLGIRMGADDDRLVVNRLAVRGSMSVSTGLGDDTVRLGVPRVTDAPASDVALTDTDESDVDRHRASLVVGRNLAVHLGQDDDRLSLVNARIGHHTALGGGRGEDELGVRNLATRTISIHGGRGDSADALALDHVRAHRAWVAAGGGDDKVAIQDSYFRFLGASLGTGDDHLAIGGNHAQLAFLSGGPGEDELVRTGPNEFRRRIVVGFEQPTDEEPDDGSDLA